MPPDAPPTPPTWIQFVPLMLLTIPMVVLLCAMARRKGRSVAVAFVLGLIPLVNMMSAIWFASLTDRSILDELDALRRQARS